jgi:hypothetical protein
MTLNFRLVAIATSVSIALAGCANATFNFTDTERAADAQPMTEHRQANFFSGFGQQQTINAAKVCGGIDKVVSVDVDQSFLDAVIATVTLGIYTPLSGRVFCK